MFMQKPNHIQPYTPPYQPYTMWGDNSTHPSATHHRICSMAARTDIVTESPDTDIVAEPPESDNVANPPNRIRGTKP